MSLICSSTAELQQMVRESTGPLLPCGNRTKPGLLAGHPEDQRVEMRKLSGIVEYDPAEYTITAQAGTPVSEIEEALRANGQYLPFDPPLCEAGATLGGMVAAGLSGSGMWKSGGLRDFILGVQMVEGNGHLVRGGGRVVKNAAGFDLPKFMVGSCGRFGILTEICFKVFPRPASFLTLTGDFPDLKHVLEAIRHLARAPLDLHAIDIEPPARLVLRVSGASDANAALIPRIEKITGRAMPRLEGKAEPAYWQDRSRLADLKADDIWIKLAISTAQVASLDRILEQAGARRRYAVCGQLVWIGWPAGTPVQSLENWATAEGVSGLVLRGEIGSYRIGRNPADLFLRRIQKAIDPAGRFISCAVENN